MWLFTLHTDMTESREENHREVFHSAVSEDFLIYLYRNNPHTLLGETTFLVSYCRNEFEFEREFCVAY